MPKEYETRVLDVDQKEIETKLIDLGAKKVKDVLQKRATFDMSDQTLQEQGAWIRLRDTGDGKIWLAYKCHRNTGESGVADCEEVEFEVSDMHAAETFLQLIGFQRKGYQENKRVTYQLKDLTFDIDTWPMIPTYVEVEGENEERVMEGVEMLGYKKEDTFQGHAGDVYEKYGIAWRDMKEITFEKDEEEI